MSKAPFTYNTWSFEDSNIERLKEWTFSLPLVHNCSLKSIWQLTSFNTSLSLHILYGTQIVPMYDNFDKLLVIFDKLLIKILNYFMEIALNFQIQTLNFWTRNQWSCKVCHPKPQTLIELKQVHNQTFKFKFSTQALTKCWDLEK